MNVRTIAIACAVAVGLTAPVLADDMGKMSPASKTFDFKAQNGSGETGTVTLTAAGDDSTVVVIDLKGAPSAAQPAHIHVGPCAKLDPKPTFPLDSVVDGKSKTTIKQPISKLDDGTFAVNVHKSTTEIATYVACADITAAK